MNVFKWWKIQIAMKLSFSIKCLFLSFSNFVLILKTKKTAEVYSNSVKHLRWSLLRKWLTTLNYFCKKLHLRSLTVFWLRLRTVRKKVTNNTTQKYHSLLLSRQHLCPSSTIFVIDDIWDFWKNWNFNFGVKTFQSYRRTRTQLLKWHSVGCSLALVKVFIVLVEIQSINAKLFRKMVNRILNEDKLI